MKWTILAFGLLLVAAPALAVAPAGKHYAGTLVLLNPEDGQVEYSLACLSFSRHEVCTESDDCGTWTLIEKNRRQNRWRMDIAWVDDGTAIEAECIGITERRGPRTSISATALITLDGVRVNAAFAGTAVPRARCLEFGLSDD